MAIPVTSSTKLQVLGTFDAEPEPEPSPLVEAQVHSKKLLKTSFDQSFEAGKRRQEALKKQERLHHWKMMERT